MVHTAKGMVGPHGTHTHPQTPSPFHLPLRMPGPVLWQAKAVTKAQDPFVVRLIFKDGNVLSGFACHVDTGCSFCWNSQGNSGVSLLGRGEGWGLGHHSALPVPRHWEIKRVFVLNLSGFYSFYLNLGYAGNCRRGKTQLWFQMKVIV